MSFTAAKQRQLRNADPRSIRSAFDVLRKNWTIGDWLRAGNRYRSDCVGRLKTDFRAGRGATHSHLREYVAASAITHCADAWSFLGRAIDSDLRGDPAAASHLAYYAELRAAVSLLAAEGVGAFDKHHAVVDGNSRCNVLSDEGTHRFTWKALEYWATLPASAELLFSVVRPGGIVLKEWLDHFSVGTGTQSTLGKAWLKQWGLDLERMSDDRDSRNVASYRPTSFTAPRATSALESIEAAKEIWSLCEPAGDRQFAKLDRHLLRYSLALTFKKMTGSTPKQARKRYRGLISRVLGSLAPQDLSEDMWFKFLTYEMSPDAPALFADAEGLATIKDARHSKQVMSRATLLLRVATGTSADLLRSLNGMASNELRFWWSPIGEDHGLWERDSEPEHFSDLWADVEEALRNLASWQEEAGAGACYRTMWSGSSASVAVLGTTERVGLWGLGL